MCECVQARPHARTRIRDKFKAILPDRQNPGPESIVPHQGCPKQKHVRQEKRISLNLDWKSGSKGLVPAPRRRCDDAKAMDIKRIKCDYRFESTVSGRSQCRDLVNTVINTLRTRSFKLFKRPFPGFLTILTL